MTPRKLPIGIQDFENIRRKGFAYVDKTAYLYRLVNEGKPYFLSRPRRFGKSLLVSTLKAYFEGKKELFESIAGQEALAIMGLEKEWKSYPVLHLDLTGESYQSMESLESGLDSNLRFQEQTWGKDAVESTPAARFRGIIQRAYEKTGNQVVVLIDEYDKPLTDTLGFARDKPELHEKVREALQGFYSVLKATDQWLRFVLLTGVTKFAKVSIFSTLNQLRDISMSAEYEGICGITESELTDNFQSELQAMADKFGISYKAVMAEMRKRYNGYHFSEEVLNAEGVFNPFSVLNTLQDKKFSNYWFKTGTPTFLAAALKTSGFEIKTLSEGMIVGEESLTSYRMDRGNVTPLLYQSGYLTIKGYDQKSGLFTLSFPNEEVEHGFLNELLPLYSPWVKDDQGFFIYKFIDDLQKDDVDGFMNRLKYLNSNFREMEP
jgi:hypothetical protein